MVSETEARIMHSVLDSGRGVTRAANVGALIAGAGLLLPVPFPSRVAFAASLLCWIAGCWLAVRVAIDASLFRVFAEGDQEAVGEKLDQLLARRKVVDRSRGALLLWRWQIAACFAQLTILIAAGILRCGNMR